VKARTRCLGVLSAAECHRELAQLTLPALAGSVAATRAQVCCAAAREALTPRWQGKEALEGCSHVACVACIGDAAETGAEEKGELLA